MQVGVTGVPPPLKEAARFLSRCSARTPELHPKKLPAHVVANHLEDCHLLFWEPVPALESVNLLFGCGDEGVRVFDACEQWYGTRSVAWLAAADVHFAAVAISGRYLHLGAAIVLAVNAEALGVVGEHDRWTAARARNAAAWGRGRSGAHWWLIVDERRDHVCDADGGGQATERSNRMVHDNAVVIDARKHPTPVLVVEET